MISYLLSNCSGISARKSIQRSALGQQRIERVDRRTASTYRCPPGGSTDQDLRHGPRWSRGPCWR